MDFVSQHLGKYELLAWLGDSAHVHAYLARQENTERDVVVKILKSKLANTAEFVERFRREAQAAIVLTHPNMVRIYEYAQQGDVLYLVEQFMPGGSLLDIFNRYHGALPIEATIRTLDQIAAVLDYAHSHDIIHHDLKPENVLYDADGNAALSDLGITKALDQKSELSHDGLEFGNPNYMSPEEWQGKPTDFRVDIYALGVLLFQMLTGQLPFNTQFTGGFAFVHLMHLVSTPISLISLRPDLPPAVESVIMKAIDKDPENRFKKAGELAAAFHAALEGKDISAIVPPPEPGASTPAVQPVTSPVKEPGARPVVSLMLIALALIIGFILGRAMSAAPDEAEG
jgi:serine/threonine-protein kinase